MRLEPMTPADWPAVVAIYEEGMATGVGTFETTAPRWEAWDAARLAHSRLVARDPGVIGWAALSPVSTRACYAGVAEVGIYVAASARGRGVGRALLEGLIASAEREGIWTLQGATIATNAASLAADRVRVSDRRTPRADREARRAVARHRAHRAPQRDHRPGLAVSSAA
jgi:L-amino acid N-acyltransferase YncA